MFNFSQIEVIIGSSGFGLLAQTADLSTSNSVSPIYALGRKGDVWQTNTGPLTSNLSVSYVPETIYEPNLELILNLKTNYTSVNLSSNLIAFAGITGNFFLQSYSLKSSPNEPNRATANYISYNNLIGTLSQKPNSPDLDTTNATGIMHSWATIPNVTGGDLIFDFEYNFKAELNPIYTLGNIYPTFVQAESMTESISFTKDNYLILSYSGLTSTGSLNLNQNNPTVLLTGLSTINSINNGYGYLISGDGSITSNELIANIDDIVKVKTTIQRYF